MSRPLHRPAQAVSKPHSDALERDTPAGEGSGPGPDGMIASGTRRRRQSKSAKSEDSTLAADSSVRLLPGVNDAAAAQLERLKITRIIDLALHFPYRYLDYTRLVPLNQLRAGTASAFEGTIVDSQIRPSRFSRSLALKLEDDFGLIVVRFFRWYPSLKKKLAPGKRLRCYGTPYRLRTLEVSHPRFELVDSDPPPLPEYLTPVYPLTSGLSQARLIRLIDAAVKVLHSASGLDYLENARVQRRPLLPLSGALEAVHRVPDWRSGQKILNKTHPAVRTVIFHDIFANLIALEKMRLRIRQRPCTRIPYDKSAMHALSERWPFRLTDAQKRAIDEVATDLNQGRAMLRLLQGDVGSGKTVVAAFVTQQCRLAGQQVALLAPTEILCEQHLETFGAWFSPQELRVELLTSSLTRKRREEILARIANREVDLVIGTHALFQSDVRFGRLGLIIIDEQQRFGVEHRLQLARNAENQGDGSAVHQLMMTATPIPRTLATAKLSILDCSVLDKMPKGRSQIRTSILPDSRRDELIERVRQYVGDDKQVFWVSPRIEEGEEKMELQSVKAIEKRLSEDIGADHIRVVHGRLKASQRERIVGAFRNREFPILVATTVVEVGVDIPNATLMVIEHSERLGLSQIHQLRGRVGRGHKVSDCVLLYREPLSEVSEQRLRAAYSTDGFELARKDLQLRGAGEFFGTEQSGTFNMRVGNLFRDEAILQDAHKLAKIFLDKYPDTADVVVDLWVGHAPETTV